MASILVKVAEKKVAVQVGSSYIRYSNTCMLNVLSLIAGYRPVLKFLKLVYLVKKISIYLGIAKSLVLIEYILSYIW